VRVEQEAQRYLQRKDKEVGFHERLCFKLGRRPSPQRTCRQRAASVARRTRPVKVRTGTVRICHGPHTIWQVHLRVSKSRSRGSPSDASLRPPAHSGQLKNIVFGRRGCVAFKMRQSLAHQIPESKKDGRVQPSAPAGLTGNSAPQSSFDVRNIFILCD
jgi:hypothetical protein